MFINIRIRFSFDESNTFEYYRFPVICKPTSDKKKYVSNLSYEKKLYFFHFCWFIAWFWLALGVGLWFGVVLCEFWMFLFVFSIRWCPNFMANVHLFLTELQQIGWRLNMFHIDTHRNKKVKEWIYLIFPHLKFQPLSTFKLQLTLLHWWLWALLQRCWNVPSTFLSRISFALHLNFFLNNMKVSKENCINMR